MNKNPFNLLLATCLLAIACVCLAACGIKTTDLPGKYVLGSESIQINADGTGVQIAPPMEEKFSWTKDGNYLVIKASYADQLRFKIGPNSLTFESTGAKYTKAAK